MKSVDSALAVLDCFQLDQPLLGVSELSRHLNLNKASVSRMLATLEAHGFVCQDRQSRRYRLGLKCWELGHRALQHSGLREAARPHLESLVRKIGETAHLAVYHQGYMTYLDVVECPEPLRVHSQLGRRLPAYSVASGRVLLASLDDSALDEYLAHSLPDSSVVGTFREELARVRTRGFAVNRGEWAPGVIGVAAPVCDHSGVVVAAVTVSAPASRLIESRVEQASVAVTAAAKDISRQLGFANVPVAAR